MKTTFKAFILSAAALVALIPSVARAQPAAPGEKVGVYDSRQVAFARFWRPEYQAQLKERLAEGRAAKAAGDEAKYREAATRLQAEQSRLHLEVFSTAPLGNEEDKAWLEARLPGVAHEAGVARVVSKWDAAALQGVPAAQQVDVTALLIRDCALSETQRKTLAEIGRAVPLSLEEAKKQDDAGKL